MLAGYASGLCCGALGRFEGPMLCILPHCHCGPSLCVLEGGGENGGVAFALAERIR